MTYSTNIQHPAPEITTLVRIRPRERLTNWTNLNVMGQNLFSTPWTKENVIGVYDTSLSSMSEAADYAEVSSSKDRFFFDEENNLLYLNFTDLAMATPIADRIICAEWDLFFASRSLNWFRNPKDTSSDDQHWEGAVQKPPVFSQGNPDLLFGFTPIRATDLILAVGESSDLLQYIYSWTLSKSFIKVWECAGPLEVANISEVFTGVCGSHSLRNGLLTIEVSDPLDLIEQEIEGEFFDATTFPNLEPDKANFPIRKVFGCVNGFLPINIDYNSTPSTTVNRDWVVSQGQSNKAQLVTTIVSGDPANDNDSSKVADASGFRTGDSIVVEQGGLPTYAIIVSSVDYVNNIIHHTAIPARTISSGDEIRRGFIGAIYWDDGDGNRYDLAYERDWTEQNFAGDTKGFTLADNFEANISGAPTPFDPSTHTLYLTVYGEALAATKLDGVTTFAAVSDNGGALSNPVGLLWNIFKNEIRTFREVALLDETAWAALAALQDRDIGYAIPETQAGEFGNWKQVIQKILQSEFLRLHFKITNGICYFTISQDGPTGTADIETSQEELAAPAWTFDYGDIYSKILVAYNFKEFDATFFYGASSPVIESESEYAKFFHRVSASLQIQILHYETTHAQEIADRLLAILEERRGVLTGLLPTLYKECVIGDTVEYSSRFLPGFAADGQINSRNLKLQRHAKGPNGVQVTLEEQKGIEDFGGTW